MQEAVSLEPPSNSKIESVNSRHHDTRVSIEHVLELDRDIGIGLLSDARDDGTPVEFRERH